MKRLINIAYMYDGEPCVKQVEADIVVYSGFTFGVHWEDNWTIVVTELKTGSVVCRFSNTKDMPYPYSRSPRKTAIEVTKSLVNSGKMLVGMEKQKQILIKQGFTFPINHA